MQRMYSAGCKAFMEGNWRGAGANFDGCLNVDPDNDQFRLLVLKERLV
jgi:hypothetical protein